MGVGRLAAFEKGGVDDAEALRKAGLVRGRFVKVKVLGDGDLKTPLTVKAQAFSGTAREKIAAAGGTCEVGK